MQHQLSAKMLVSIRALYYLVSQLINISLINSINYANLKLVIDFLSIKFYIKRALGFKIITTFISLIKNT